MGEARVRVSLVDGKFEGSETFINAQLEKFDEVIQQGLTAGRERKQTNGAENGNRDGTNDVLDGADAAVPSGLEHIFAATDNSAKILKDIPGNSNREKMVNAAKLLAYGSEQLLKRDTLTFDEVSVVCEDHGCLDRTNLASSLKSERGTFLFSGTRRKQTLKLTVPGQKSAAALVEQLKAGSAE